jgi:hypothetical protein
VLLLRVVAGVKVKVKLSALTVGALRGTATPEEFVPVVNDTPPVTLEVSMATVPVKVTTIC